MRETIERVIVGSCLTMPGYFSTVTAYLSELNFVDPHCRKVFVWLKGEPNAYQMDRDLFLLTLKNDTGLTAREIQPIMIRGVCPSALAYHCLKLLELCFRQEAARILNSNRDEVLKPLAPIERDVLNPANDVWKIVTAAANYCYDAGMEAIAESLTELISKMDERARGVRIRTQIEFHISSLRETLQQHPHFKTTYTTKIQDIIQ